MSSSKDKEVQVSDELKQLGFDKFSIPLQGKNLMVWHNGNVIISSFDKYDLVKSIRSLTKKFEQKGIDQKSYQLFTTYLTAEYLKLKDLSNPPSNSYEDEEQNTTNRIIDETKKIKSNNSGITFERWAEELAERRNTIRDIAERNFPHSWHGIEFTLSVLKILNISECTLPFAGIMLSRAGGNKTLSTSIVIPWPQVYYTRNFTAKAFVSHNTSVSNEVLKDIDMLPKIRFKLLLTPELTPLFSANEDQLMENLGIITSVLDGRGYVSHSGAQGKRGYHGNYMFVWVGAAVDIPHRVHKLLATLGPKLYFFRLPYIEKTDQELLDNLNENFEKKRKELEDAIIAYLVWFEICPILREDKETGLLKMKWNSEKDDQQAKVKIKELGKLLAKLRGHVDIWSSRQHEYSEYAYSFTQTEDPARAITQLYNLARGHALFMGRNYVALEDVPITAKVVLSTASIERVSLLDLLLARGGRVTLSKAAKALSMSKSTILKTMTEFAALKLVDLDDGAIVESNQTNEITLKTEFGWLLTEDFTKMRDGFIPVDNSKYIDEGKEIRPPSFDKESIFWERFTELEKQSIDGIVQYQKLKDSLVASNVFFVGDVLSMTESMAEKGRLEMVKHGYYRRAKPLTNKLIEQTTITNGHNNNNNKAKTLLLQCLYGNGEGVTVLPPTCSLFFS